MEDDKRQIVVHSIGGGTFLALVILVILAIAGAGAEVRSVIKFINEPVKEEKSK